MHDHGVQLCLRSEPAAGVPLDVLIHAAVQADYACLDITADTLAEYLATYPLGWLDARLREQGVYIAAIGALEPIALPSQVEALVGQAQLVEICAHMDALGGGVITLTHHRQPGDTQPGGVTITWLASVIRTLADLAAPFEVQLALECDVYAGGPAGSVAHCQEIVRRTARSNVGLCLNAYALCSDETMGQIDDLDLGTLWLVRLCGDVPSEASELPERTPTTDRSAFLGELYLRLSARGFVGPYSVTISPGDRPLTETARTARSEILRVMQGPPSG
jgi:hypothetical protein